MEKTTDNWNAWKYDTYSIEMSKRWRKKKLLTCKIVPQSYNFIGFFFYNQESGGVLNVFFFLNFVYYYFWGGKSQLSIIFDTIFSATKMSDEIFSRTIEPFHCIILFFINYILEFMEGNSKISTKIKNQSFVLFNRSHSDNNNVVVVFFFM